MFITGVDLLDVHEDYAKKIVFMTKDVMSEKITFVNNPDQSEYVLKISLIKEEFGGGVVVTYKLLDPMDKTVLWSYSTIAYRPDDFILILDVFYEQFTKWNGFKLGVGIGAMMFPIEGVQVAPALDLSAHYMFNNQFVTLDVNGALSPTPLLNYGAFLSYAYMFDFKQLHPYVGGGVGASLTECDPNDMSIINGDVSLLAKGGLILKFNRSSAFYVFDVRLTYNLLKSFYVEDGHGHDATDEYSPASYGLQTTVQVWW